MLCKELKDWHPQSFRLTLGLSKFNKEAEELRPFDKSYFCLSPPLPLLSGGGDSICRGSKPVEGVLSDGGGDSGSAGHLPGAAGSVLRAGGRSCHLASWCHSVLREGPCHWSGGRAVLPGPLSAVWNFASWVMKLSWNTRRDSSGQPKQEIFFRSCSANVLVAPWCWTLDRTG